MCLVRQAIAQGVSRRAFLKSATAAAATSLLTAGSAALAAPSSASPRTTDATGFHTRLVLLGTGGGPLWWPESRRASTSTALVVGEAVYIVDLGYGSTGRWTEAAATGPLAKSIAQRTPRPYLQNARAVLFTHLHMDHTTDYPALLLMGHHAGLGSSPAQLPLAVFGPGDRGQLERFVGAGSAPYPHIVRTDSGTATPGTKQMTNHLWQAYAQTINDFTLDDGAPDFTSLVDVKDIGFDAHSDVRIPMPAKFRDPNTTPCPPMDPFDVYKDAANGVRVRAILVDHHQMFPAFAYRFDTSDGSVVISGDTGPNTNGNLQRLAKDADVLVHEVIDDEWINRVVGRPGKRTPEHQALYTHFTTAHTLIQDVGAVAEAAGAKTLVLSHIVPGDAPKERLLGAQRNFSGKLVVGEDLMEIGIGKASHAGKR